MNMDIQLKALYVIYRQQVLLNAKDAQGQWKFPPAYLHAVASRIAPVFHSGWHGGEEDPFDSCYVANHAFVNSVVKWMDEEDLAGRKFTYYDLESKFGHERRSELIDCIRYCALDQRFSPEFYAGVLKNQDCPIEALNAAEDFRENEVTLL
jgi:hypothetical protein